jgi:cytochrome c peroxidase
VNVLVLLAALAVQGASDHLLTPAEVELALELSPVPPPPPDPTNAWADDERAARLGQALFYDTRLSGPGTVSCATCHDPARGWSDGRNVARGVSNLSRHSMSLWNVAYNRWFFWDGRKDTLWSQALGPLEDPREQATTRVAIARVLFDDEGYRALYEEVFGALPPLDDRQRFPEDARPVPEQPEHPNSVAWRAMAPGDRDAIDRVFVHTGKALAAFERRILTRAAPFDRFVEGLRDGDPAKLSALEPGAQRGFALFAGKARCIFCHDGPTFSDLEFHDNRIFVAEEGGDPGRKLGIRQLKADPFNTLGGHADDGGETGRRKLGFLVEDSHAGREFKTPMLRNVALSPPYMHEGQLATLEDVVHFYDTLEGAAPATTIERLIAPIGLTPTERADLVAFLQSLTDDSALPGLLPPSGDDGLSSPGEPR